ncbi:MAG: ABC transporter ATP-binding protein [Firmicutes bacterium]|nr:ABC transporter ATP-binding protein [Bacillota bacterium]
MGKIFKNMLPYWKSVIVILVLLIGQAWCDLALPQYTSDIIDVGIQNNGIEHILPEKITAEEYSLAQIVMTDDEKSKWLSVYDEDGEYYSLNVSKDKELDELDDSFILPVIMNYRLSMTEEASFRQMLIAQQPDVSSEIINNMTIEQIGEMMKVELKPFTREIENEDGKTVEVTCVDIRPLLGAMLQGGKINTSDILAMRDSLEKTVNTMGSQLMKSTGVAYAAACDSAAGIDIEKTQKSYLWASGARMLAVALLMGIISVGVGFVASRVGAGVGRDLRRKTFDRVISFSGAEMDKFSTASLITRSTNDIQQIQMVTAVFLRMLLYAPILGIGGIIKVSETGAGMGYIIVIAVVAILAVVMALMIIAMPKFKLMQKLVDALNLVSREILTGISVIRAFGREKQEEQRFEKANKDLTSTMLFTNRVMTFMMPMMTIIMNGLSVLIVWVAAHKIDEGSMQVGAMTAFITYTMQIVMSFLMITMMSIMLPRAAVSAERIDEVLKTDSSVLDPENPKALTSDKGVVKFENVSFRYPGADDDVLHNISFTANPGQTTAIIGSTGSGKSTLINLIPRLYDVTEGKITVGGEDVRNLKLKELRDGIGFVPQKGVLFSGTIASNLRFGNQDASDDEIAHAATIAQAADFIEEKPEKYDSPISQGGANVSGGQKQRLTIARAIAKNPNIFIFDDSFSALDLKTDAALRKALNKEVKDSTVIIVAQRISTILHADNILVLDKGSIVGSGTHEELLKNCEVYRQIARSQMSASELGIEEGGSENE